MYGSKKIFAKIMNGKLIIRVGGGYILIDEFLQNYAEIEKEKMGHQGIIGPDGDDISSTPARSRFILIKFINYFTIFLY